MIKKLSKEDKYILVFNLEKKEKLNDGYYCYLGPHDEKIHQTGNILFFRRLDDHEQIHENVKKISDSIKPSDQGYLHYFLDNPLFMREFHDAINI